MHPQSDLTQQKQQNPKNQKQQNNKLALAYMLLAVLLFSAFPFALTIGNANAAPFLFVALMSFSSFITGLVF